MKKFAPFFVILAASLWAVDGIVLRPSLYSLPVTLVVFIESTIYARDKNPVKSIDYMENGPETCHNDKINCHYDKFYPQHEKGSTSKDDTGFVKA